jgi:hypothetical protein
MVVHDLVSHYLKSKINPYQHGFSKTKSASTNLVTFVDFITPLVCSQGQADAIYFDLSNAFELGPHSLLLHTLTAIGLSGGYLNYAHMHAHMEIEIKENATRTKHKLENCII